MLYEDISQYYPILSQTIRVFHQSFPYIFPMIHDFPRDFPRWLSHDLSMTPPRHWFRFFPAKEREGDLGKIHRKRYP